ncbi:MAG: hypothetical protein R3258_00665 [Acidimicrobiia bacterium]|nr:hypothetical protein [Acidimicrobiia bacterium]
MVEIPEDLLRRSAEAKAKALGVPVEDVLAEMKGEGPPVEVPQPEPVAKPAAGESTDEEMPVEEAGTVSSLEEPESKGAGSEPDMTPEPADPGDVEASETEPASSVATMEAPPPAGDGNGSGNGKVATSVTPRPTASPAGLPEGVRTQRLLTVVKARAIQDVKTEPQDKVNTWPHLMLMEFGALLLITGLLIIMSVVIHSPLLDPANVNATPNPSKAPWYFLGLQELLSYFDPQIAGVTIPTITGMIGFMMVPFVDKNPSNRPSDRKFAIVLYTIFLAGSATLTIFGVLFRGKGFNFSYPWKDGIFFDDLKDWVHFE